MLRKYENRFRQIGLKIMYYRKMKNLTQESLAEAVSNQPHASE